MSATPDPIYAFIAEFDYTDEAIERWAQAYPHLADNFRETAMAARLEQLQGPSFDAYLPPDPEDESHCWE